jgi:MFS transporter, MHS family, proline/betaine transporter
VISSKQTVRSVAAITIGNTLEWFDNVIYGYLAVSMAQVFFPKSDPAVGILLTLGTFAASFLVRPLGAVILGAYADRSGRKSALTLSMALMSLGTLMLVLVPSFNQIGILAPILVLLGRLLQGFSVGGEFGSATAFLVEQMPSRRAFAASWVSSGQGLANAMASGFGLALASLDPTDMQSWGWRIPFAFGLVVTPVGWYIRKRLVEPAEFQLQDKSDAPVAELVKAHWVNVLIAIGAVVASTGTNYILVYMPTFGVTVLGLPPWTGFVAALAGGLAVAALAPVAGMISDRIGTVRVLVAACLLLIPSVWICFLIISRAPSFLSMLIAIVWLNVIKAFYSGPLPAFLAELFPTRLRSSGVAISYNVAVPIFGGFTPVVAVWLVQVSGSMMAPACYLIFLTSMSLGAVLFARSRPRADLTAKPIQDAIACNR